MYTQYLVDSKPAVGYHRCNLRNRDKGKVISNYILYYSGNYWVVNNTYLCKLNDILPGYIVESYDEELFNKVEN